MSQSQFPVIQFGTSKGWAPHVPSAADVLPAEGLYEVNIDDAAAELTSNGQKAMLVTQLSHVEPDVAGKKSSGYSVYTGVDRNNEAMDRNIKSALHSAGVYDANGIANLENANTTATIEEICGALKGRRAIVELKFERFKGTVRSKVDGFASREAYNEAVAAKRNRRMSLEQWMQLNPEGAAQPGQGVPQGTAAAASNFKLGGIQAPAPGGVPQGFGQQQGIATQPMPPQGFAPPQFGQPAPGGLNSNAAGPNRM